MVKSGPHVQRKNPATFDRDMNLPINQSKILIHIALNGPIDAYRTSKDLKFPLTTTQLGFKTLTDDGLIRLKDIVKGKTDQNRKIYDLSPRGFCFITEFFLKKESPVSYDKLREFLDRHCDLFPDLLKKWDFYINHSRDFFSRVPTYQEQSSYLINTPDISTSIWCDVLRSTCLSVNNHYRWFGRDVTVEEICSQYKDTLSDELYQSQIDDRHTDGFVYALKQDEEIWSELVPKIQSLIEDYEKRIVQFEKILR
ncbi:MAG TPA: hypothetical protein PKM50_08040 [Methanoregula sp.]|nr:hypothetical protein [Methanoregula sp.]